MANVNKLGALWRTNSQNPKAPAGKGQLEIDGKVIKIVLWKNSYKTEDRHPDYIIERDVPREGYTTATATTPKGGDFHAPSATRQEPQEPNPFEKAAREFEDEIPY